MKLAAEPRTVLLYGLLAGAVRAWSWRIEPPLAGHLVVLASSCLLVAAVAGLLYSVARAAVPSHRIAFAAAAGGVLAARAVEILAYWRLRYDTQPAASVAIGWLALAGWAAWILVQTGRGPDARSRGARLTGRVLAALLALACLVSPVSDLGAAGIPATAALLLAAAALAAVAAGGRPALAAPGLLLLALGFTLGALPAGTTAPAERRDVVLITVDTLRRDRLGLYGYDRPTSPHLDTLAQESVVFDAAVTPIPLTNPAHASLMTGLYPPGHGAFNNGEPLSGEVETLAERLRGAGYDTAAVVSSVVLSRRASSLDRGFRRFDDRLPGTFGLPDHAFDLAEHRLAAGLGGALDSRRMERTARWSTDAALAWMTRARRPYFLWIHYYDPHGPYDPPEPERGRLLRHGGDLPEGFDWYTAGYSLRRAVLASEESRGRLSDLYDGEIAFTDRQIGRVIAALRDSGRLDRTLLAVTADHGESLTEHGCFYDHSICLHDPSVRIPLLLRLPGGRLGGRRVAEQVRLFDLFPTLLQATVGRVPEGLDGEPLGPLLASGERPAGRDCWLDVYRPEIEGDKELSGLRRADGTKLIRTSAFWNGAKRVEASLEHYDCAADPQELVDLAPSEETQALLERVLDRRALRADAEPAIDPDLLETLRALGYLGAE